MEQNKKFLDYIEPKIEFVDRFVKDLSSTIGISNFGFLRIYTDNRYFYLTNNYNLVQDYLSKVVKSNIFFDEKLKTSQDRFNFLLWPKTPENFSMELYLLHNYWNGLTLMEYNKEKRYVDLWWVASTLENNRIDEFYLNNPSFLNSLIRYFANKYEEIFKFDNLALYKEGFDFNNLFLSDTSSTNAQIKSFLDTFFPRGIEAKGRYGFACFTHREIQCFHSLSAGKTMKEISIDLKISVRTVEKYIQSIQSKTGYILKSDLISLYNEQIKGFVL